MEQLKEKLMKECIGGKRLVVVLSRSLVCSTQQQSNSEKLDVLNSVDTEIDLVCLERDLDEKEQEEDLSFSQVMPSYQQPADTQALDVVLPKTCEEGSAQYPSERDLEEEKLQKELVAPICSQQHKSQKLDVGETLKQMMKSAKKTAIERQIRGGTSVHEERSTSSASGIPENNNEDLRRELTDLKAEVKEIKRDLDILRGKQRTTVPILLPKAGTNLEHLLDTFTTSMVGPAQSNKKVQNDKQIRSHVEKWILHTWGSRADINKSLQFLGDIGKLVGFMQSLADSGKAPSTQQHFALDIEKFLIFLKRYNLPYMRLSTRAIDSLLIKLKAWRKGLLPQVILQQQEYKKQKTDNLIQSVDLLRFVEVGTKKLAEAIDHLAKNLTSQKALKQVVGLLVGVMATSSGHRRCVFLNMRPMNVMGAEKQKDTVTISVSDHKTSGSFGRAKLTVTKELWGHLKQFLGLRPKLPGYQFRPSTVFFSCSGAEMLTMGKCVTTAWRYIGLPGKPNLTDIRTAICTYTERNLEDSERKKVAYGMCHSLETSRKFYVPEASAKDCSKVRIWIMSSLLKDAKEVAGIRKVTQPAQAPSPSQDQAGGSSPSQDQAGGSSPSQDQAGGPSPSQDQAGGSSPSQDLAGGPRPSQDLAGGPSPSQEQAGGSSPSQDLAGGPSPSQDLAGGPRPSQDLAGGPRPSQDLAGGPSPSQDLAGGPRPSQDLAGGPRPSQLAVPGPSQETSWTPYRIRPLSPIQESDSDSSSSSSSQSSSSSSIHYNSPESSDSEDSN
ncbi:uncharacterized protein LOC121682370 [Alosa sapidissima]|uniref:uncharacterized protein LOC121682370 n=1 Tax=Alosa sapidissima TaxID=34773 RepID=UPI001C094FF8|nr:uncharacterized protein LOC121682370 [Alosa sapidissima]